uniref:Uncharacterized protein n=1 Tax=Spongospora subterranea TaxID=70186 RepID=A0A0H5RA51_9EUKA|eukprot:CRZ10557.1 hypothetical protein [Spongospora subterranea]
MMNPNAPAFDPSISSSAHESPVQGIPNQLSLLVNIFPELHPSSLQAFLIAHDNDLMICVERLLAALSTPTPSPSSNLSESGSKQDDPKSIANSTPVCKYFLNGHCLIANCQFLHSKTDRSAICRFYLRGHCARGSDCSFLHELDNVTTVSADPSPIPISPSLSRVISPSHPHPPIHPAPFDLVAKMKLESLQAQWAHVNPQLVEDYFRTHGKNLASVAEKVLRERFGPPSKEVKTMGAAPIKAPPLYRHKQNGPEERLSVSTPIVTTGDAISSVYFESRDAAMDHARRRNSYFTNATAAFLRGDGALAKELSQKGRYHHNQMELLHQQASGQIFDARNENLEVAKGLGHVVDVHGLHATEAVDRIHRLLSQLCAEFGRSQTGSRSGRYLDVITGVGRHSYSGVGKVRPAVLAYAQSSGYQFQEMSIAGSIRVYF